MICPFKSISKNEKSSPEELKCIKNQCSLWTQDFTGESGCAFKMIPDIIAKLTIFLCYDKDNHETHDQVKNLYKILNKNK